MGKRRSHGEGTVYFDASRDRWVGQVWLDGRRRKVTARTKADASAKLGRLVHGDAAERHVDRRLTVAGLLADWQAKALPNKALAPSTLERHRWAAGLLTDELGTVKVADLTVTQLERTLGRLATGAAHGHRLARASLEEVRSTARQALAWGERRRVVAHNVAAVAELPADAAPPRARRALTGGELSRLFDVLDGYLHPLAAMFLVMARLGLRPGEAAGVCLDALDLPARQLSVVRAVQLHRGRPVLVDDLKTAGSRRTLAMPAMVAEALETHVATAGITSGLLWPAPDGGPLWPSTVRAELAQACGAAGIEPPIRPNELRHTCATRLTEAGLPPHQVADLLGHTSTRMVDAVYRHRPPVIGGADVWDEP